MTQAIQDSLPHFEEMMARGEQQDIPAEATQMHLRRQFSRWRRYANFSKDPEFQKRSKMAQVKIMRLLENNQNLT